MCIVILNRIELNLYVPEESLNNPAGGGWMHMPLIPALGW